MDKKYTHDELIERMKSPGWSALADDKDEAAAGSLEDVVRAAHGRHSSGNAPGLIRQIETTIELDMLQLEMLWRYLGLPV
jgi:hypothetical protein